MTFTFRSCFQKVRDIALTKDLSHVILNHWRIVFGENEIHVKVLLSTIVSLFINTYNPQFLYSN